MQLISNCKFRVDPSRIQFNEDKHAGQIAMVKKYFLILDS